MAVILPNGTTYIHCPKTAGSWVRRVFTSTVHDPELIRESGNDTMANVSRNHHTAWQVRDEHPELKTAKMFGFIRDPLSWLKSYWAYRTLGGWLAGDKIDSCEPKDDLSQWLVSVAREYPGQVGVIFREYYKDCDYLARVEDLPVALILLLRKTEVPHHTRTIRKVPHANVTGSKDFYVSPFARKCILDSEWETYTLWERSTTIIEADEINWALFERKKHDS